MGAVNYEVYVILIVFNLIQFIFKKILNLILNFLYFFRFSQIHWKRIVGIIDVPINKQIDWHKIKL